MHVNVEWKQNEPEMFRHVAGERKTVLEILIRMQKNRSG